MRIIFAGTPDFACPPLAALIERHEVIAVFTQPDRRAGRGKKMQASPVKQLAMKHDIPIHQPDRLKGQEDCIASLGADIMVVVAYGMILPKSVLALPPLGCLNIHASLLPRWRGAAPIQRAIEAGDSETGVSIMQMEAGLDTGPVFSTLRTDISPTDTSASLHDRLAKLGAKGIVSTLELLAKDTDLTPSPQDDSLANYAHKIIKAESEINWQLSAKDIHCKIRAFIPWPVCQSHHQGSRLRIWEARLSNLPSTSLPSKANAGSVVSLDNGIHIACGDGVLRLDRLQRDGSKPLDAGEFLNGYSVLVGDQLASPSKA